MHFSSAVLLLDPVEPLGFTFISVSPLVLIRYHSIFHFSIRNIVQTHENATVQTADLRKLSTFSIDTVAQAVV